MNFYTIKQDEKIFYKLLTKENIFGIVSMKFERDKFFNFIF